MTASADRTRQGQERRRQLRQQRRQERLRQLWRLLLLSGTGVGLGWLLLQEGWVLRQPDQIEVMGSQQVSRDQVIREGKLQLPLQLLSLQPQILSSQLAAALPVERIQISRLMLPPRLRISLVDREAVAQAQRRTRTGIERGYVDRLGHWMTRRQQQGGRRLSTPQVMVLGWQEQRRPALAAVLAQRDQLGSRLQQVRFEPNGSLWLRTTALGNVHLGGADAQLERRLEVLRHLSSQLPQQLKALKVQSIDLSNPDQPELGLPGKARLSIGAANAAAAAANAAPAAAAGRANPPGAAPAGEGFD